MPTPEENKTIEAKREKLHNACARHAKMVLKVRDIAKVEQGDPEESAAAIMMYAIIMLRVTGCDEKDCLAYVSNAISAAFAVQDDELPTVEGPPKVFN